MHCFGLFFTNVDVEHLFQKVANLHDLRSNVTNFTCLYSEHLAKFHRGKRAEGKFHYQYRQFSHKRELSVLLFTQCCESTATHVRRGAITQETDLS